MVTIRRLKPLKRSQTPWSRAALGGVGLTGTLAVGLLLGGLVGTAEAQPKRKIQQTIDFEMVRSTAAANGNCAASATGEVKIASLGPVEEMHVKVSGLPPNTEFDFFVITHPGVAECTHHRCSSSTIEPTVQLAAVFVLLGEGSEISEDGHEPY